MKATTWLQTLWIRLTRRGRHPLGRPALRRPPHARLQVESLEDRVVLSGWALATGGTETRSTAFDPGDANDPTRPAAVYIAGYRSWSTSTIDQYAIVSKYRTDGMLLWSQSFGGI